MTTSGTVSTTVVTTQEVIDHAYRRCKLVPQQITGEMLDTARRLLFFLLSTLSTKNIPLWTVERQLRGLYERAPGVETAAGTVEAFNVLLRSFTRLSGTPAASAGVAANAFDGDLLTSCNAGAAGNITLTLDEESHVTTFGILPNVTGTWNLTITGTPATAPVETVYSNSTFAAVAGRWFWLEAQSAVAYESVQASLASGTLDLREFVVGNNPSEIPLGKTNRDDYANLPNKEFTGRPTQYWLDRQRTVPVLRIWPTANAEHALKYLAIYAKRQVQDIGTLTQELEIPQRYYLAVICELARQAGRETKEVAPELIPQLDTDAREQWALCWDGETDGSPIRLIPQIRGYTR